MKHRITYIFAVATCLCACERMIDIYPVDNNTADQFYTSEYEINQAVIGIYSRLGRNGTNTDYPSDLYYQALESRSDNLYYAVLANAQRDQADMRTFQCTDVTSLNTNIYRRLYSMITDANTMLEKTPEEHTKLRAEARFLRALAYFDLIRTYGPQPVLDHVVAAQDAKALQRQPLTDAYKQIIDDLKYAADNLEDFYYGDDAGRAGSVAASVLLGQVYVTMAGYPVNDKAAYQEAVKVLTPIMDKVDARWADNFNDVFDVTKENTYDIFSVQFASGNQGMGSSLPAYITSGSSTETNFPEWVYTGYTQQGQDLRVDTLLVKRMKAQNDLRLEKTIADGYWTTVDHGYTKQDTLDFYVERSLMIKYLVKDNTNNTIKAWNDYPLNCPILRPADAYLLLAEALVGTNKASEAAKYLNKVRERAGLDPITTPTMEDIMFERRCEFLGEGKRFFDLVRQGPEIFVSTLKDFSDHYEHVTRMYAVEPSTKDMLLPIPQSVMNIHSPKWEQNPGY